jgi:hypothetical protein
MNIKKIVLIIFLSILFINLNAQEGISIKDLKAHLNALASDEYEGRKPGTTGDSLATVYIENQFKEAGLKVEKQAFEVVTGIELGESNSLVFNGEVFSAERDYIPLGFSKNDTINAKMTFVGFGIEAKNDSIDWNDYNIEVKDRWVVVLTGKPKFYRKLFYNKDGLRKKVLKASDKGARGVIFVNSGQKEELSKLRFDKSRERSSIPVIHMTKDLFEEISSFSVNEYITEIEMKKENASTELNGKLKAIVEVNYITKETFNIIASVKGKNPVKKNSHIVIGAHYDHLGYGGDDSGSRMPDTNAVHNGADDNASGVGAVIELAKYYSKNQPNQNFKFVAFGAEEMGLLGSKYYAKTFAEDGQAALAMINFDMLGRLDEDGITVGGTGTAKEFESLLESVEKPFKISTSKDGFGPSDHASFYIQKFPVLFVSTGAHSDYHTPFDDVDKINFVGYKQVINWALNLSNALDDRNKALTFQETKSKSQGRHGASYKVTFGIIPDFASKENIGLKVDGTRKGGPAERAGMLKDDIITAIDGKKVTNIYDYMYRLGELEEGDTATVDILRNGEKKIVLIQL